MTKINELEKHVKTLETRISTLEARAGIGAAATTPVRSLRFVNTESKDKQDTLAELTAEEAAFLKTHSISEDTKRFSLQIKMCNYADKARLHKIITSIRSKRQAQVQYFN